MASRGDLVMYNGERGVVCCTDPLVMRCVDVHAYVPLRSAAVVLEQGYDPGCTLRDEVRERIRAYLEGECVPTGG